MFVAGTTAGAAYAGPVTGAVYSLTSGSTKSAASRKVADDDRAAATILNPNRSKHSCPSSGQIPGGEQQVSDMRASLELVRSSLALSRGDTLKAMRLQANAEPDRALQLLEDTGR